MDTSLVGRRRRSRASHAGAHPVLAAHRGADEEASVRGGPRLLVARSSAGAAARDLRHEVAVLRTALVVGAVATAAMAWWIGSGSTRAVEPELARLLRGMAALKGLVAAAAAGVVWWRLGQPARRSVAIAYIVCTCGLLTATALIWQLAFIPAAAMLFHAAGFGALVLALREGRGARRLDRHAADRAAEPTP